MRYILIFIFFVFALSETIAQEQNKKVIQFTGVVFGSDSTSVVPGTHVYIPKSGRGTTTNPYGFFSLPVLEGDSVIFSAVGFKRAYFIIPKHDKESSLRVIIALQDDIKFLEEVEIRPYPTESMFKEALITMELPDQKEYANIYQWLNAQYMSEAYLDIPASPNANHQYYMQMQRQAYINRYSPPQNQLLNPFAWANFINSLKRKN
ncbi:MULTISPECIES: carboxypeptidase-like regulatory domain-containing protein [unclassified Ekhidna]|uniref:carboxypeptidase-like regulatory domain-containing protein n=1 Tax=unclassified Ekhidna TaxID=2632188 RepID=UPI0032DF0616